MNNGLIGEKSCHSQDIFYNTSTATWAKVFLEFLFERITCLSINNREGRVGGRPVLISLISDTLCRI